MTRDAEEFFKAGSPGVVTPPTKMLLITLIPFVVMAANIREKFISVKFPQCGEAGSNPETWGPIPPLCAQTLVSDSDSSKTMKYIVTEDINMGKPRPERYYFFDGPRVPGSFEHVKITCEHDSNGKVERCYSISHAGDYLSQ